MGWPFDLSCIDFSLISRRLWAAKYPGGHSFGRFELDCIYMVSGTPVDLEKETMNTVAHMFLRCFIGLFHNIES